MAWEVLLTGRTTPDDVAGAADFATFVTDDEYADRAALLADADRFDAVVVQDFDVDEAFLDAATNLRVVAKRGVGVDTIDVDAAAERGVVVCNTPGANARAVAEHAFTLLAVVRGRVRAADRHVRDGGWDREAFVTRQFRGATIGVFGCGDAGSALAGLADGAGMAVLAHDPYVDDAELPDAAEPVAAKADLFERADAVSLHVPLTDETRGAVGAAELDRLAGGVLVNTARGGVVDEAALVAALEDGTLAGAGLDVFAEEPPPPDSPLLEFENVVVTPHVAGWTVEANAEKNRRTVANLRAVHGGRTPETAVTPRAESGRERE